MLAAPPELHRLSIEEYHRLVARGGLEEGAHLELIDGLLLDVSPKTPQHENAVRWLMEWLIDHIDRARLQVMVAGSLTIGASEPEPDLAVIERSAPALEHPSRALLVIEVALSSAERDLSVKPNLYAQAVQEYWVVDLQTRRVITHRAPGRGGYREVEAVPDGESVSARALDLAPLRTGELFAAAFAERRGAE